MASTSLVEHLLRIKDPRMDRTKKHLLIDILVITVLGFMSGNDNWFEIVEWAKHNEEWLKTFLTLENGIPSHDTFGRVFALMDPVELESAFRSWVAEYRKKFQSSLASPDARTHIAIDGKKIRGTTDHKRPFTSALGMVSAWCSEEGLVLGQTRYDFNENHEKLAMLEIVKMLHLKGCIVSLDANGATQEILKNVAEKQGDFVIGLKTNVKSLHRIADQIFSDTRPLNKAIVSAVIQEDQGHGRTEKRTYELIDVEAADFWRTKSRLEVFEKYPSIKCLGRVTAEVTRDGKATTDSRFFMTSLAQKEHGAFATAVRSHWEIENKLNWVLDVAFREDRSTVHQKNAMQNVAVVRRLALNLLKSYPADKKTSVAIKRKKAGWDHGFLHEVLITNPGQSQI